MDTHCREGNEVVYSACPRNSHAGHKLKKPEELLEGLEYISNTQTSKLLEMYKTIFHLSLRYFEYRYVPESFGARVALGLSSKVKTLDANIPPTSKTNLSWVRSKAPLLSYAEQAAALAWVSLATYMRAWSDFWMMTVTVVFYRMGVYPSCQSCSVSLLVTHLSSSQQSFNGRTSAYKF